MVNNPYFFSTMATAPSTQIADSSDNPHSGLIKALSIGMTGSYAIKAGNDFAITVASASTVTVAAGKILRDGLKVDISASGTLTLGTVDSAGTTKTNTLYSLIVVAANNSLAIRTTTTEEAVPAYTLGDIPIALLLYTGDSATMEIQFLTTNKTDNSLTLAYESSSDFTPTATFTSASGGTTITNTVGDFTIDNQDTNDQIILQLGTDTAATAVVIKDDSGNNKLAVTGDGKTQAFGTLEVGTDLKMSTSSDDAIIENVTENKHIIFKVNDSDGGGASTEIMRIDGENSRVGIGATTPTAKLEVAGDVDISRSTDSGQTRTLSIEGARNASGTDYARIDLENYDSHGPTSYVGARISAVNDADGVNDGSLVFSTNNANAGITERVRIDDEGNVGIGTNSPDAMLHLSSGVDQKPQVILENTQNIATDASTDEPELIFKRSGSSNSGTSGDIGKIRFIAKDDGGAYHDYCVINADAPDETAGTEDGRILIYVTKVGASVEHLRMSGSEGVIFNHNQEDINFMIAGKDNDNIFYVDGGTELVGIGTASPSANLHIVGAGSGDHLILEGTLGSAATSAPNFVLFRNGDDAAADIDDADLIGQIVFRGENDASTPQEVNYATIEGGMDDTSDGSEDGHLTFNLIEAGTLTEFIRLRASTRDVVVNDQGDDIDFRVEGNTNANLLFTDASADMVGIGTNAPVATLDILSGGTFRNTRLLTVSVSGSTTLTETAHAGRYNICAGNITLPSTSTAGEHYAILNTTGGDITIGRNGNNINGAGSDITLATYKAATCIAIGSNNWMVVG